VKLFTPGFDDLADTVLKPLKSSLIASLNYASGSLNYKSCSNSGGTNFWIIELLVQSLHDS